MEITIWCHISNNGDGSASARFYESEALANLADELDEEGFCDSTPTTLKLTFPDCSSPLKMTSKDIITKESWLSEEIDEKDYWSTQQSTDYSRSKIKKIDETIEKLKAI